MCDKRVEKENILEKNKRRKDQDDRKDNDFNQNEGV